MEDNPLVKLHAFGQSIWLDFIRRGMLFSGELEELIERDGLLGVTSNPSIFEKAIGESHDYDEAVRALALQGKRAAEIYRTLVIDDIRRTADLFGPVYERTEGRDGLASLEVSPRLAHDTAGTIAEARSLWQAVDRPNVLIKVPATAEGLPAIRQLLSEGVNVNITLLFGIPRYREVAEAYLDALEGRAARGLPLFSVASVASFFLSRIDVLVDPLLEKTIASGGPRATIAASLRGRVAIAEAKVAYQAYQEIFGGERFSRLAAQGARTQRLLWASTGTKNPAYSDVMYVESLIGSDTVNTLPMETLNAYRDHGNPAPRLQEGVAEARAALDRLAELGIDLDRVAQQLEDEGVQKFVKPFDLLMSTLQSRRTAAFQEAGAGRATLEGPSSADAPGCDIGMVGLGVMGRNLLLNVADHGYSGAGYDRDAAKVRALGAESQRRNIVGAASPEELIRRLRRPRAVILLVPAGPPVDAAIEDLLPYLEPADVIVDGGNSHFREALSN